VTTVKHKQTEHHRIHRNNKHVKTSVIGSDGRMIASYRAMTHTNDAQTVHTCQTRSVCKPRPRLTFEARLVFEEIRYVCF